MRGIHVGTRLSALALALGIASVVGCLISSKSDPLADAEKMVGSHPGANTAVTAANFDSATSDIMEAMYSGISRAIEQSTGGGPFSKRARPSENITLEAAEYAGLSSGSVKIKSGHLTTNHDNTTGYGTWSMNVAIELNDFSDDGVIFFGGTIEQSGSGSVTATGMTSNANAKANIAVAGKYQDSMSMDITMAIGANGKASLTGTVTVGGQTHNISVTDLQLEGAS